VQSGLSFLNEESIELIASSRLGKGRFDALRQRMLAYREQLDWPVGEVSRLQFERIFRLFVDFCRYHPEYYGSVRAELAGWALHRSYPALAARAEAFVELDADSQRPWPGTPELSPMIGCEAYSTGGPDEAAGTGSSRLRPSGSRWAGLRCRGFEIKDVPEAGLVSWLPVPNDRRSYWVESARPGGHFDLQHL
jgi:hypothetical protein